MQKIIVIVAVLLLSAPQFVLANSYKVTPLVIDQDVQQRDIFSETVTITNNKHYKINLYASVNEVSMNEGGDIVGFRPASISDNRVTPTSWVAVSRGRISIEPGETKTVPLQFKIHPQAEAGVYHMLVGFGEGHNRPTAEAQAKNGTAPGVIVTLSVDQNKSEFLKLKQFLVDRFITAPENSGVTYTLTNPGSAAVVPTGEIIISNPRGEEVGSISVNPNQETLAPGQQTTFTVDVPTEGMLGKYKAFLSVDYGTTQLASVYDTAFFYVIPWQKLMMLLALILFVTLVATIILHRRMAGPIDEEDHHELPLFVSENKSIDQDHDINLKQ